MNLLPSEQILMEGDYKQITLTTHRIRQENKTWSHVDLISIMLEEVTSCEYIKRSNPIILIVGILFGVLGAFAASQGHGDAAQTVGGGAFLSGLVLIIVYFLTIRRGLNISSPTAKIKMNTKGMKSENIKAFIDRLEAAKNDRLMRLNGKL